jgi:hypothetical protein
MKIALMAMLAVWMGTMFTSCLNSDGGDSWDTTAIVTVKDYMGVPTLLTDDGYTFIPSNPSLLQYSDGTYAKRCEIAFSWNEGVVFDNDRDKTYKITIVQTGYVYPVREYYNQVDIIENDFSINEVTQFWGANGEYLTVSWKFYYTNTNEAIGFELYPESVEDDVLVMRLRQSLGTSGTNTSAYFMSFTLPTLSYINDKLETELKSTNDSIQVKIAYNNKLSGSDEVAKTSPIKIKIK